MSTLTEIIISNEDDIRNQSLDDYCQSASYEQLLDECRALELLRHNNDNLYVRVRALLFLYAIHRFHLPRKPETRQGGYIPYDGHTNLLRRRFEEAIDIFLKAQADDGPGDAISSALAVAYHNLGFQTLANQVRRSVRAVNGNQWMFRIGHPADQPLRICSELQHLDPSTSLYPILREATPVRMDLTHSGWSDIFFLGMDFPEGARVINTSIDLSVRSSDGSDAIATPKPPVEAYLRVIDQPILRLASVDLGVSAELSTLAEVYDFARDYLGLLKAAVIASGLVTPAMEGAQQPLSDVLAQMLRPGLGLEIVSQVNGIPKGSRLAVSTSLLACLIAVCMRATGQAKSLVGQLTETERRLVAARAILGEWLAGSGGGWQDSGGLWPGIKLIQGVSAADGNIEFGISRGCLLPVHRIFTHDDVSTSTRMKLQESLVLVHGGMAQDVGPILEMVTEKYLLRSRDEWRGRQEAIRLLDEIVKHLNEGDIQAIGEATHRNFTGPIQTIIPWAGNLYTDMLIEQVQEEFQDNFWGFWMLGGMSGGGMGFLFDPDVKPLAQRRLQTIMSQTKAYLEQSVPFAMEPVVYDFTINERGTWSDLFTGEVALMPPGYYTQTIPTLLRLQTHQLSITRRAELDRFGEACRSDPQLAGMVQQLFDRLLPSDGDDHRSQESLEDLLERYGFDSLQHEQIRSDLRSGRIGLAQNRLPVNSQIEDVTSDEVIDATGELPGELSTIGLEALQAGAVAVITLAGGTGSRWTKGAGVVKALNPFCRLGGRHRTFIEIHLAKSRHISRQSGVELVHVITTSYMTHEPIKAMLAAENNYCYEGPLILSPGRFVGLRMVPMTRDLRYAWEEMPQQMLDEQAQKMQDSLHAALITWAQQMGEGSDYTDNIPRQCLHPVGHWFEVPNLLLNGTLLNLLERRPQLKYLMVHNVDTMGVNVDPALLGLHISENAALTTEVIPRRIEDRGGGLARVNGHLRLIEGLAMPREETEFELSYYNSSTTWVDIDQLLGVFDLSRDTLQDQQKNSRAIRTLAARMPTYITLKEVKKRWGKGHEDVFPVTQFEKLWGDMTTLPELSCSYMVVPRFRGQQLKEPGQLDGWLRDGSADYLKTICKWE